MRMVVAMLSPILHSTFHSTGAVCACARAQEAKCSKNNKRKSAYFSPSHLFLCKSLARLILFHLHAPYDCHHVITLILQILFSSNGRTQWRLGPRILWYLVIFRVSVVCVDVCAVVVLTVLLQLHAFLLLIFRCFSGCLWVCVRGKSVG